MPNFSIALTGLGADTVALNTIGNNLANLNTTAFKDQTTTFQDLFYQNIGTTGSGDQLQVGVGTRVASTSSDFTQGSTTTTNVATDMAVNGTGFFVVDQNSTQALTRAGNFQLSAAGNLTTTSGESVMGYGVTAGGAINLNGGLVPMTLPVGISQAPSATTTLSLTSSLDASAAVPTTFSTPLQVYDSLGTAHTATVTYTKASTTTWNYAVTIPGADETGTPVGNTGSLTFNSSGTLISPSADVTGIQFPGLADGAADLNLTLNLYNSSGAPLVTQTAGASNTTASSQNGYEGGAYQSFAVDANGIISATFSNGQTTKVGQIAVATVVNSDGLTRIGSNDYQANTASGAALVGVANVGGRGSISGESLEASNVDISTEFSSLIVAQRAFEANSKTVTTFDSVVQDAIAMVR
jgi:flagellar hook protein FlgE